MFLCSLDCGIIVCSIIMDVTYGNPIVETMSTYDVQSMRRDIIQDLISDGARSWKPTWAKQTTTPIASAAISVEPLSVAYPKTKKINKSGKGMDKK